MLRSKGSKKHDQHLVLKQAHALPRAPAVSQNSAALPELLVAACVAHCAWAAAPPGLAHKAGMPQSSVGPPQWAWPCAAFLSPVCTARMKFPPQSQIPLNIEGSK